MSIKIFYDKTGFRLKNKKKVVELIEKVIAAESKKPGDLNFIFTNDKILRKINKEFLAHNYNTDVISFCYNQGKLLEGEVFISIERVKTNAHNYKVSFKEEIIRVIVHGLLHICGYEDNNVTKKKGMINKEDLWIEEFYKR